MHARGRIWRQGPRAKGHRRTRRPDLVARSSCGWYSEIVVIEGVAAVSAKLDNLGLLISANVDLFRSDDLRRIIVHVVRVSAEKARRCAILTQETLPDSRSTSVASLLSWRVQAKVQLW